MSVDFEQVLQSALSLPDAERARLVENLIGTLEPEQTAALDDAWLAEIDRRSREFDEGQVQAIPWEQVKDRVRGRLQRGNG